MKVKAIPDGFHTIQPYLAVKDAHGLIDFLKKAFDAKVEIHAMPDGTVANAMAQVGDSMVLIGQAPKDRPDNELMPVMLYLYVEDADAWYHKALAAGGQSIREPADQVYGDRVGAVRDLANNQWWFATHIEDMSSEELTRRVMEKRRQS
jgi:PhnB protein